MSDLSARRNDYHQSGFKFVDAELNTGLPLSVSLWATKGGRNCSDKVDPNRMNARKAYDSALHFLSASGLNADEDA